MNHFAYQRQHSKLIFYANYFGLLLIFFTMGCLHKSNKKPFFFLFPGFEMEDSIPSSPPTSTVAAVVPAVQWNSSETSYVSANTGAVNYQDITWSSNVSGDYTLRLNATSCTDGTVLAQGPVVKSTSMTHRIQADDGVNPLTMGSNRMFVCIHKSQSQTLLAKKEFEIVRDETPPSSLTFTPGTGVYGSAVPNIAISCSDLGGSGCYKIAYRTGGSDPGIAADGTPDANSVLYTNSFSVPDAATTAVKAIAVDVAGNVGSVSSASTYTVNTAHPNVTINSISTLYLKAIAGSSTLKFLSNMAGTFSIRKNSTNCTNGTVLLSGPIAANTLKTTTLTSTMFSPDGNYTVHVCVAASVTGNIGYTTYTITKDSVLPTITSITPTPGTMNLSVNQRYFTFKFSKDMDVNYQTTAKPGIYYFTDPTLVGVSGFSLLGAKGEWLDARTYRADLKSKLPELFLFELSVIQFRDIAGNSASGAGALRYGTAANPDPIRISDTGQTDCSDAAGNTLADCSNSGQDGETTGAFSGLQFPAPIHASYPNDIVSFDTRTGLAWKTCLEGFTWTGATCVLVCPQDQRWDGTACISVTGYPYKTWTESWKECSALNAENSGNGFAGKTTWRLPYISEYYSILNYGGATGDDAIPEAYFPGLLRNNYQRYWTGTLTAHINATTVTGTMLSLSNGPVDPTNSTTYYSAGAWAISVFGGVTQPGPNKTKYISDYTFLSYNYTSQCVAD
ncbi:DUF1566 domain-containing protein [Leptospira gomenensis]|uniref:DUF1566 domain-containing protein n=2 Tax=Leptospira gomenensis TaxID=2484974 RepID=A0A5F1YSG2_9LEPT|nr:DUF1566 domain-containing protein [Leptospira gomenensis]TGK33205.1 DUF1566 domain-containing protein [Leptospira gomenensis]TGK35562.1 DUF1566 domain-containing protein [Leptospira gomenensis]TGK61176.1 DUF1566 domain-containing protein [Leptospira gomenensis]